MMELVDVTDSKSVDGNIVWVRVPLPAPCEAALFFEQFYRKAELLSICKPCNDLLFHLSHKDRLSEKTQKSKIKKLLGTDF